MSIFLTILLGLTGLIVLVLIIGLFMRKNHYVKRDVIINAPAQTVFDYVKLLKNQDSFNKHAMSDANRQREFKGVDGTVGYIYSWKGDRSAGEGEKEIMEIVDGKKVVTEIRFTKPMKVSATVVMETEPLSENQTRVSWSNAGVLNYPLNILIPMMEKNVRKDMDISLGNLKEILEKES